MCVVVVCLCVWFVGAVFTIYTKYIFYFMVEKFFVFFVLLYEPGGLNNTVCALDDVGFTSVCVWFCL